MYLFYTPAFGWAKAFLLELQHKADPKYKSSIAEKFKVDVSDALGVPAPEIRATARQWQANFSALSPEQQLDLCEHLLHEGIYELRIVCFQWLSRQQKHWQPGHLRIFERWLQQHITGWPDCDDFCSAVLGPFFLKYPQLAGACANWSQSPNAMTRRAGLVALIQPAKKAARLYPALMQCDLSLRDENLLVQKALAWLLKETSKVFPQEVSTYLACRAHTMRTPTFGTSLKNLPKPAQQMLRSLRGTSLRSTASSQKKIPHITEPA